MCFSSPGSCGTGFGGGAQGGGSGRGSSGGGSGSGFGTSGSGGGFGIVPMSLSRASRMPGSFLLSRACYAPMVFGIPNTVGAPVRIQRSASAESLQEIDQIRPPHP
jgi:hypothetical protein